MSIEMVQFDNTGQIKEWLIELGKNKNLDAVSLASGLDVVIKYYKFLKESSPPLLYTNDKELTNLLEHNDLVDFCYKLKEDLTIKLIKVVTGSQ